MGRKIWIGGDIYGWVVRNMGGWREIWLGRKICNGGELWVAEEKYRWIE